MKTFRTITFLAVSFAALRTSAQFVFLEDNRTVDASGGTNGVQVYAQTNFPSTPFAPFNAPANGTATDGGSITSSAYQASSLSSNAIYVTNGVFVAFDYSHAPPSEYGSGIANARFQISFSVQAPTVCTLTGVEAINGLVDPAYATLTSAHHGTITMAPMMSAPWNYVGVLQPDTYVLNADLGMNWYASSYMGFGGIDQAGVTTTIALIAEPLPAQFVFLEDNRNVDASGGTNGVQVYAQTNFPSTPFAPFNAAVSGRANDDGGYITSSAYQASSLLPNAIYVTNGVSVAFDYSHAPPSDYGRGIANGRFQISFSVQTPTVCSLTGVEYIRGMVYPPLASLTSAHHGTITTAPMMSAPWNYRGVLQPDTYVLDASLGMNWYASYYMGFGGIDNAGVTTTIALIAEPPPRMTLLSANSNMFRFTVLTAPRSTNRVWARPDLASSISPWLSISTNVADTNGVFQFADSIVPGQTAKFYEVSCP